MDRLDIWIKSAIGLIVGIISWTVEMFGIFFVVLLGMMALDFITGLLVAGYEKKINSSIGRKGLIRKTYQILLIGAVSLIDLYVLKANGVITDGVSAAYIVVEFTSLVENGSKLGMPIHPKIKDLLLTLKGTNKSDEHEPI